MEEQRKRDDSKGEELKTEERKVVEKKVGAILMNIEESDNEEVEDVKRLLEQRKSRKRVLVMSSRKSDKYVEGEFEKEYTVLIKKYRVE